MSARSTVGAQDIPEPAVLEPPPTTELRVRLYVYAATCSSLTRWADSGGIGAVHLGVAADPLDAIHQLSVSDHGRGGLVVDEIIADPEPWSDWIMAPLAPMWHLDVIEARAGTLRITLPDGSDVATFSRRFAALVAPLEAERPRFTPTLDGWIPASDLCRWSSSRDVAYVYRALAAAIASLTHEDEVLDLLAKVRSADIGEAPD